MTDTTTDRLVRMADNLQKRLRFTLRKVEYLESTLDTTRHALELAQKRAEAAEKSAARPAPGCGEKVRALVKAARRYLVVEDDRFVTREDEDEARRAFLAALDALTDADLAPDPVVQECVEACIACSEVRAPLPKMWDENEESHWQRCLAAGRAARAKGGAS